jgi:hypothetical protein
MSENNKEWENQEKEMESVRLFFRAYPQPKRSLWYRARIRLARLIAKYLYDLATWIYP